MSVFTKMKLAPININIQEPPPPPYPPLKKEEEILKNPKIINENMELIKKDILQKIVKPAEGEEKEYIKRFLNMKPISTHKRFFEINVASPPRFISLVFIDTKNKNIVKLYNYNSCIECNNILVNEIASQIYASSLDCKIKIPTIKKYGMFANENRDEKFSYDTFFYIIMENISDYYKQVGSLEKLELNDEICNIIESRVNEATKCLGNNKFFHNDLHKENVFIDTENMKIGLIDFGKAKLDVNEMYRPKQYLCNKKNYNIGLSPVGVGGKTKRKRHNIKRKTTRKYKKKTKRKLY
jgi:serine/threonine protein kinase